MACATVERAKQAGIMGDLVKPLRDEELTATSWWWTSILMPHFSKLMTISDLRSWYWSIGGTRK